MYFTYNLPYLKTGSCLQIGSAKSYNYKSKMSKNLTKKYLPTICLMALVELAITCNLGSTPIRYLYYVVKCAVVVQ